jgi:hypothetical protein
VIPCLLSQFEKPEHFYGASAFCVFRGLGVEAAIPNEERPQVHGLFCEAKHYNEEATRADLIVALLSAGMPKVIALPPEPFFSTKSLVDH